MNDQEKDTVSKKIIQTIQQLQQDEQEWINLAALGISLSADGIQYKQYGFSKLQPFLHEFQDVLEFTESTDKNPPVRYVRLKDNCTNTNDSLPESNFEQKTESVLQDCPSKPAFQEGKPASKALGYVRDLPGSFNFLRQKIRDTFTQDELDDNLKISYDNGDILYYEYDNNGSPVKRRSFTERTVAFAVNTRYRDDNDNCIYAQYNRNKIGFIGIFFSTETEIYNRLNSYKIGQLAFRDYEQANEFIQRIHDEVLPGETWNYGEPAQNVIRKKTRYEILESYLRTVLFALTQEYNLPDSLNYNKVRFSKDRRWVLFNSGLLSKYATDILIVGEVYPKGWKPGDQFAISNPDILKRGKTELAEKGFAPSDGNVDMVSFFESVSQIVYDATVEIDTDDIEKLHHCIDEGIKRNRFPKKCKEQYERGELEDLANTFTEAIHRAERIARRNYKYVVPQYRVSAQGNKIQFLMPIYMLSKYDQTPDFALVLSENTVGDQKFYKPETVLELAWAYNNARVICKPDNTWLKPEKIEDCAELEDESIG